MHQLRLLVSAITLAIGFASIGLADTVVDRKEIELTDEKQIAVEIDFGIGELTLSKGKSQFAVVVEGEYDDDLFEFDFDYRKRRQIGDMFFDISGRKKRWRGSSDHENNWSFEFTDKVPINLKVDIGAAACAMDLGGMRIGRLDLDIGATECKISFDEPNGCELEKILIDAGASSVTIDDLGNANFRELEFDGGVGSYDIDFSGKFDFNAEAEISIGLGSMDIIVPEHIGVRIYAEDSFLSSIDIPEKDFIRIERGVYETENWDSAKWRFELTLDVGLGSVDVRVR
jgi:hypothetical protein